jgi:hypothetical protein
MTAFSQRRILLSLFNLVVLIVLCQTASAAERVFAPERIGKRLRIHNGPIIENSDSLLLDHRKLIRDDEYRIDYLNGVIYINTRYSTNDTLTVYFTPLPTWLKKYYGIMPNESESVPQQPTSLANKSLYGEEISKSSGMIIKGSKKFSVLTQTGGNSNFSQSLDLTIKGEISPGFEVSGSVADRGYDPAYGTVNSRISELDKLNFRMKSRKFFSEIGNLEIRERSDYGAPTVRQVSGLLSAYTGRNFSASGLFARPRGRFHTVRLTGIDKVQGPYRVTVDNREVAIVPGSEKVWLDGQLLRRGADKDYVMDYPAGGVTFTQRILIDDRSRIEIDFEPLTTDYRQEMYRITSGLSTSDSTVYARFDFMRQTDDKNRLKTGELNAEDIKLLQSIGDSVAMNLRYGAVADSLGNYIEMYDTLGQRYFVYVGDSLGDYSVSFSPVGFGSGDYIYKGVDEFEYVGGGNGDYIPYVRVPVPSREDYFETELGIRPSRSSTIKTIVRQSNYDRNLFSRLNDNNNLGGRYIVAAKAGQQPSIQSDKSGLAASIDIISKNFKASQRRVRPDLARIYLIPDNLSPQGGQKEARVTSSLTTPGPYNLFFNSGYLDYDKQFNAYYGTMTTYPEKQYSFLPTLSLTQLKARLDTSGVRKDGRNQIFSIDENYQLGKRFEIGSSFKFDRRWNQYQTTANGTTEWIYNANIKYRIFYAQFQQYYEDTLITTWQRRSRRDRVALAVKSQTGAIKGDLYLVGQRLTENAAKEDQLMVRLNTSYTPTTSNLMINGSYTLSDENRNERGIRYIEVEPGQGKYIYENGQYIPDLNGNYIEVEEVQSGQASVKKGEKSFGLTYYPHGVYLKLMSNISEDLLAGESRDALWVLPFYSGGGKSYFYRKLYYSADLKFIEIKGGYFVNLAGTYNYEERQLGGRNPDRYDRQFRIRFNEVYRASRISQEGLIFKYYRDSYYSSPGDIDGFEISLSNFSTIGRSQILGSIAYRYAEDIDMSHSKILSLVIYPRIRFAGDGEISLKLEPYLQDLKTSGPVSYRLTDDRYGKRGMRWTLRADYKLKQDLKISISFNGRHSDDRKPRIVGRGELVASF